MSDLDDFARKDSLVPKLIVLFDDTRKRVGPNPVDGRVLDCVLASLARKVQKVDESR